MTDDLKDIDPELIEAILNNADAFIAVDTSVDEIILWGEGELDALKVRIKETGGTAQNFNDEAVRIETGIAERLRQLEADVRKRHSGTEV